MLRTDTDIFSISIFLSLAAAIVATELINLLNIVLEHNQLKGSYIKRIITVISSPLIPATYLFRLLKLKLLKKTVLDKFASNIQSLNENKRVYEKLKCLDAQICSTKLMCAELNCNENVLENLTQLTISSLIIVLSHTNTNAVETVEGLFMQKNNTLTYIFASMSFCSILRGQLNFLQANKKGCVGTTGKLVLIPYFIIGTSSR